MGQESIRETENGEGHQMPSWPEVFLYFLFLGFVNVGGPVAQITMMFNHMVEKRRWLTKERFVKIMAFCHMLPGPEALQLAIYVGYLKRRLWGGILAGLTFIVPGAAVIIKLGKAAIRNWFLAVLLVGAFVGMQVGGINFLLILVIAGVLNLLKENGRPGLGKAAPS